MSRRARMRPGLLALLLPLLLGACAGPRPAPVADDGRRLDDALLARVSAAGERQRLLRQAIVRSAVAPAPTCATRWELPFTAATAAGLDADARLAWRRVLGVDEGLVVVAAEPETLLPPGTRIVAIDGGGDSGGGTGGAAMLAELLARRDAGRGFTVRTAAGATVPVAPFAVCRGEFRLAADEAPTAQDYHWDYSVHPAAVMAVAPTPDEVLWMVLWTQGLAEEGGGRMQAYRYGLAPARLVLGVASLVSGIGAVARLSAAGAAAGEAGLLVAKHVVASAATDLATAQAARMMSASSENRAHLEGVSWAAGTVFDRADAWAFARMRAIGADPLAGIGLHRKLVAAGHARNAFVLDAERLPRLQAVAEAAGLGTELARRLDGPGGPGGTDGAGAPDPLAAIDIGAMPLSSLAGAAADVGAAGAGGEATPLPEPLAMPLELFR